MTALIGRRSRPSLLSDVAPINRHRQPRHERGRIRAQPQHCFGDFLRLAHTMHGLGREYLLLAECALVEAAIDQRRADESRTYRVDADLPAARIQARRFWSSLPLRASLLHRGVVGSPCRPATDAVLTIPPPPFLSICVISYFHAHEYRSQVDCNNRLQFSIVQSGVSTS
jgi:hypothetical protein